MMLKIFESVYAKNNAGKVLEWYAEIENKDSLVTIRINYGELGGKMIVDTEKVLQGKNLGKANETTPFQQAVNQVESRYRRKKKQGYKSTEDLDFVKHAMSGETIHEFLIRKLPNDRTDENDNIKPMKAQQYYRSKKNWISPEGKLYTDRKYYYMENPYQIKEKGAIITKFPCLIQPKINGVRALIYLDSNDKVVIRSKEGLDYNIPHIKEAFQEQFKTIDGDIVFDGELYIPNTALQDIASAVKATNLMTPSVMYYAFDLAISEMNNVDRYKKLKEVIPIHFSVYLVPTYVVSSDTIVQEFTDKFIKEGYEGSILRSKDSEYQFGKRKVNMTKLKRILDDDFMIMDIVPQEKNRTLGQFFCVTDDGKEFMVNPTGSEEYKQLLLIEKSNHIGKMLQCFFYEYTNDEKPFHIVKAVIRDYE